MKKLYTILILFTSLNHLTLCAQNKILVITGGHDFEEKEFYEMFDSFQRIEYDTISHPKVNLLLESSEVKKYSCLVFYDMVQDISENQKKAMIELLGEGMGMLFLHHALVSYQSWPEFEKIIGGKYYLQATDDYQASTYRHDIDLNVEIVIGKDANPITKGINSFIIHDEVYGGFSVGDHVIPLISTDHPESSPTIAWWHKYKNARVVYIQLGHDHWAYENNNYRLLLQRAIHFVSQDQ